MAILLHIETSGPLCSVAVSEDGNLRSFKTGLTENDHASQLTILIRDLLAELEISFSQLAAVAVSEGPGSYTGLRIGVSTAKGLCHGLGIPIIAVSTLKVMSDGISAIADDDTLLCPLIDAKRMEVYTAVYTKAGKELMAPCAAIASTGMFDKFLNRQKILFFGSGLIKCQPLLQHSNAAFLENHVHTAASMISESWKKFTGGEFANLIGFEPLYLKEVYTTKPAGN